MVVTKEDQIKILTKPYITSDWINVFNIWSADKSYDVFLRGKVVIYSTYCGIFLLKMVNCIGNKIQWIINVSPNVIDINIIIQMWCGIGSRITTEIRGGWYIKVIYRLLNWIIRLFKFTFILWLIKYFNQNSPKGVR